MILATSRLTLREAEARDVPALAGYQRDPRFVAARQGHKAPGTAALSSVAYFEHHAAPLDAARVVQLARRWATERPRVNYQLIVTLKAAGSVIGCAGLRQAGYPPGGAEVGIEVHPDHWGFGYAREALSRLVAFGRDDLALVQLTALSTPTNLRAHRLLQHLGFTLASSLHHEARFQLGLTAA